MDARGHLGCADDREVEDGDPDAHRSGQGTPAHLVDADDGLEALGGQARSTPRSCSPRPAIS